MLSKRCIEASRRCARSPRPSHRRVVLRSDASDVNRNWAEWWAQCLACSGAWWGAAMAVNAREDDGRLRGQYHRRRLPLRPLDGPGMFPKQHARRRTRLGHGHTHGHAHGTRGAWLVRAMYIFVSDLCVDTRRRNCCAGRRGGTWQRHRQQRDPERTAELIQLRSTRRIWQRRWCAQVRPSR